MLLLLSGVCSAQTPQAPSFRKWTDTQARTLEASFLRVEGETVFLRLPSGGEVPVPIASLSEADRSWVAAHKDSSIPQASLPAAEKDWPRTVALQTTPSVTVVREDPEKKEFVYETEHYEFLCDSPLGANLVREFSRIFEATWLLNCVLPLDFKPAPEAGRKKFRARIYTFTTDYFKAGGPEGSGGVYMGRIGELRLPLSSLGVKMFGSRVVVDYASENYDTLIHEITHQMMSHWIPKLPLWYVEGSAVYAAMAKYENGRFSFLQPEKLLRNRIAPGGNFQMVPLEKLMNLRSREWLAAVGTGTGARANYASALALTFYFYHLDGDGKGTHFRDYIRAVGNPAAAGGTEPTKLDKPVKVTLDKPESGPLDTSPESQYLLRGRSYEQLEKDVQKAFRRSGIDITFAD